MYKITYEDYNDKKIKCVEVPAIDEWTANYNFRMGKFKNSYGSMWLHSVINIEKI